MNIKHITAQLLSNLDRTLAKSQSSAPVLKAGQSYPGVVVRQLQNQIVEIKTSLAHLQQANRQGQTPQSVTLRVHSPQQLQLGQRVEVQISEQNRNVLLKTLPQDQKAEVVQRILRQVLPFQASPRQFFQAIEQTLKQLQSSSRSSTALPAETQKAVEQALRNLFQLSTPHSQISRASILKNAILRSGLFLESQLRNPQNTNNIEKDFKGYLLRLILTLSNLANQRLAGNPAQTPLNQNDPESTAKQDARGEASSRQPAAQTAAARSDANMNNLRALLQSAFTSLNRIQANQLAALTPDEAGNRVLQMDIPVVYGQRMELLELEIRHRDESEEGDASLEEQRVWSAQLNFDFENLGPFYIRLRLSGDSRLFTTFWAERPATLELIKTHADQLRSQLNASGLESEAFHFHLGAPETKPQRKPDSPLLDLEV